MPFTTLPILSTKLSKMVGLLGLSAIWYWLFYLMPLHILQEDIWSQSYLVFFSVLKEYSFSISLGNFIKSAHLFVTSKEGTFFIFS